MKNININLLFVLLFLLTACSDWLDVDLVNEEEERKLKEKEHEKEVLQQSEKGNMRLVDEVRRRSLNEVIAEAELKAKRRKKMDEIKKTRKMTEHHMER